MEEGGLRAASSSIKWTKEITVPEQCRDCGELSDDLDELTKLCHFCAKIYSDEERDWEREEENVRDTTS